MAIVNADLNDKVALVTGSTSGIGLGIARTLAQRGCDVVLNGFADEQLVRTLKDEFKEKYNARASYEFADLAKSQDVDGLCQKILQLHPAGIDILVNNAGFQHVNPIEEFSLEKWNDMIAVMLTAPFQLTKVFVPYMKKKAWGRIVNISSVHGLKASPNKAAYCSAKHGILGLTKVIALETAGTGVTCNAICPGCVDTPIFDTQIKSLAEKNGSSYDEAREAYLDRFHPSKTAVGINHLAEMVTFLCTDAGSQITGSSLVLDGGWNAK